MNPLRLLASALTFLTRLPWVARFAYAEPEFLARSAYWWPVIGAALGVLAASIYQLAYGVWSSTVAALLALASTVLITGASGGLGGLVARHLADEHGVRHLLLVSRGAIAAKRRKKRDWFWQTSARRS